MACPSRTRSQLTLPDNLLRSLPQDSPMKHARSVRRLDADPKRSMSPPPHGERESKRAKKASDPEPESRVQPPASGRAQSVPMFPTSFSLPFIDLKNPPPSPRRARSCSPGKEEPKLDVVFGSRLDIPMDVEEDMPSPTTQSSATPQTTDISGETTSRPSPNPAQSTSRPIVNQDALFTPTIARPNRLLSLSPLTPLPETPYPFEIKGTGEHPSARSRNFQEYEKDVTIANETSQFPSTSGRQLHLSHALTFNPLSHPKGSTFMGSRPVHSKRALTVPGRKSSNSSNPDAFSILMQASQKRTNLSSDLSFDKGKQRADIEPPASASSTEDYFKAANGTRITKKHDDLGILSNKLKSRMRPREKPKIEPVLTLPIPSVTDPGDHDSEQLEASNGITLTGEPLDSTPSTEQRPQIATEPSSVPDAQGADITGLSVTAIIQPSESPAKDLHHNITNPLLTAESGTPPTIQDAALPESAPTTLQQEQNPPTIKSPDMVCDQPAENSSPCARPPAQALETIVSPILSPDITEESDKAPMAQKTIPIRRTTRSITSKLKTKEQTVAPSDLRSNVAGTPRKTRLRSASTSSPAGKSGVNGRARKVTSTVGTSLPSKAADSNSIVTSLNYAKPTTSSNAKVTKSPTRSLRSTAKSSMIPSINTRSSSPFSRLFPATNSSTALSSLSTLSTALERLRKPPPSRPNTSTGFYSMSDDAAISSAVITDNTSNTESHEPSTSTKTRRRSNSFTLPSSTYSASATKPQSAAQQPISRFLASKPDSTSTASINLSELGNKPPPRPGIFGVGIRGVFGLGMRNRAPKVSRKTSLPMVVGSPVKGSEPADVPDDGNIDKGGNGADESLEIVMDTTPDISGLGENDYLAPIAGYSPKEAGKKESKGDSWKMSSGPSLALSASLGSLHPKRSMGPPPIHRQGRITRSISGSHASVHQTSSPEGQGAETTSSAKKPELGSPLKFLKDCVVYVDVRTDDGDDAGSLFVEMLEGAGAKVLTRVGQTCTHIIFKNGLLSTMGRYRLLRDPKPLVVGIAWVVECAEQKKHIDESKFLVDLSDINIVGVNKRRKSLLPKLVAHELDDHITQDSNHAPEENGEPSIDGSNSSLILDDLPPLERARRRKSLMIGPRP
ncbi:hypothetical protein APHAL10511_004817 [Amanita phalloides]|nr:hypothetical protein APHAL10511_004817 [Amanita phalloides]